MHEMSLEKIKSFFGVLLLMSINSGPAIKDHWLDNYLLRSVVADKLSENNFNLVRRFLHCNDNDIIINKIEKVGNVVEKFINSWNKNYSPSSKLAVDETIIPYRGRSKLRQYKPSKPTKYGIKAWSLADSSNGYMLQFKVYEGKSDIQTNKKENVSFNVVVDLLKPYYGKKFTIYTDSIFTSPLLFEYLYQKGIDCIGMLMLNRKHISNQIKQNSKSNETF